MNGTGNASRKKRRWRRFSRLSLWVFPLLIVAGIWALWHVGLRAFVLRAPSMEPTLVPGDRLLVRTYLTGDRADIRRGELVVFQAPILNRPVYVKRIIGLPGDRLRIVKGRVYVNGKLLPEPYVRHDPAAADPFANNFPHTRQKVVDPAVLPQWRAELAHDVNAQGELLVPPNHYFVLGDNFDHSWDSRYWGFVSRDAIFGRPVLIYWSSGRDGVNWSRLFKVP